MFGAPSIAWQCCLELVHRRAPQLKVPDSKSTAVCLKAGALLPSCWRLRL